MLALNLNRLFTRLILGDIMEGGEMDQPDFFKVPPNAIELTLYWWHTGQQTSDLGKIAEHINNCPYCSGELKEYRRHQQELREQNRRDYQKRMAKSN